MGGDREGLSYLQGTGDWEFNHAPMTYGQQKLNLVLIFLLFGKGRKISSWRKKIRKEFFLQGSGIIYYKLSDYFSQEITSILPTNEEKFNIKEGRNL